MSAHEHIADFIRFMEASGVEPAENIAARLASGTLIRFACTGDNGKKNGWAILYLDARPAGAFGNYKQNTGTLKWKAESDRPALSQEQRAALQREWTEARERREAERMASEDLARNESQEMWANARPADPKHRYIVRKEIDPAPLRQQGENIFVPMFDREGVLWNLQRIKPAGDKRFMRGARVLDTFCTLGTFDADTAILCEGYATADAIHRETGLPCVVAFNTANLPRVARLWVQARPDLDWIIFADDDHATGMDMVERGKPYQNPGIETAEAVATELGIRVAYPDTYTARQREAA